MTPVILACDDEQFKIPNTTSLILSKEDVTIDEDNIFKTCMDTQNNKEDTMIKSEVVLSCDTCGLIFNNPKYLDLHIRSNHEQNHKSCSFCNKIFKDESILHLSLIHI